MVYFSPKLCLGFAEILQIIDFTLKNWKYAIMLLVETNR